MSTKVGERELNELAFRYADYTTDDDGNPVLGFKVNAYRFSAYDWEATNYDPVDGSQVDASNPGRYDAVNIYGDEYKPVFDYSGDGSSNARGLGNFFRTGYKEVDLVDYNTENLKFSTALHWRLNPEDTYESPELLYGFNSGFGTTVYQGDNRFSLRDIEFYQHKLESKAREVVHSCVPHQRGRREFIRSLCHGPQAAGPNPFGLSVLKSLLPLLGRQHCARHQ